MTRHVLTLSCRDRPGIVHMVASALLSVGANTVGERPVHRQRDRPVLHAHRVRLPLDEAQDIRASVTAVTAELRLTLDVRPEAERAMR